MNDFWNDTEAVKREDLHECRDCTEAIRKHVKDFIGAFYISLHLCSEYQRQALENIPKGYEQKT